MITGVRKQIIHILTLVRIGYLSWIHIRNPKKAWRVFFFLDFLRKKYVGNATKGFKANGRYFFYNHVPGFPSNAFDSFHKEELNNIEPFTNRVRKLRSVIFSITKKCPLNCEHCYELELLNRKEKLSLDDLKKIVSELQSQGVTQIYLSGGEPMARLNDLIEVLRHARKGTDFWLITSGTHLTLENAKRLKQTGRLTGVSVSLDHFLPEAHNAFRNRSYSYTDAINAVQNCLRVNLAVGLAICTTKSFVSWENLMQYAELAKNLGVHFIQLQEPYAVGGYEGKDVYLQDTHIKILDSFYKEMNYNRNYINYPIVIFHGHHQREIGCYGGGNRYLYIDSNGDVHSCPYCRTRTANILEQSLEQCITKLEAKGCLSFANAPTHVNKLNVKNHTNQYESSY